MYCSVVYCSVLDKYTHKQNNACFFYFITISFLFKSTVCIFLISCRIEMTVGLTTLHGFDLLSSKNKKCPDRSLLNTVTLPSVLL